MDEVVRAFFEAAETFAGLHAVPEVAARWDEPSTMDGCVVGAVVGHVNAAIERLEAALDKPAPTDLKVIRLGRYYAGMKIETPDDAQKPMHGLVRDLSDKGLGRGLKRTQPASVHSSSGWGSDWPARSVTGCWISARSSRSRSGWTTSSGPGSWSWSYTPTISPSAQESTRRNHLRPPPLLRSRPSWPPPGRPTETSQSSVPSPAESGVTPTHSRSSDSRAERPSTTHAAVSRLFFWRTSRRFEFHRRRPHQHTH